MCIFTVAAVVHMFVWFRMQQGTIGVHVCDRDGQTEMVRVESTDSPLSATAVVKAPPQGTGVCEITF